MSVKRVELAYTPRKWVQEAAPLLGHRTVLNCHRGSGKTAFCVATLCEAAIRTPKKNGLPARFGYVAQSIGHAKQTAWGLFQTFLAPFIKAKMVSLNTNDLAIRFWNGNEILLSGIDNAEKNRGLHLSGLVLDEAQLCSEEIWNLVLYPTTVQNKAWVIVIGTPNGPKGLFYKLYCLGEDPTNSDWVAIKRTMKDTGEVDPEIFRAYTLTATADQIKQEFYCDFQAAISNRVYSMFDAMPPEKGQNQRPHIDPTIKDRGGDLYVGLDFNVAFMPAIIGQKVGNTLEVFAEIVLKNMNTDMMASTLQRTFPGRRIFICPDASGKARSTKSEKTDFHYLRERGFRILVHGNNPAVHDRVQAVNVLLENAAGERRLFISPKCTELLRTLNYQQIDGSGNPKKDDDLDHAGDALGYLVWQTFPLKRARFQQKRLLV